MASGFQIALLLCLASGLLTAEAVYGVRWSPYRRPVYPHHVNPHHTSSGAQKPCCQVCPAGWTQFGDRCFYYQDNTKTWDEAEKSCVDVGGHLASIHSDEEHDFVRDYMKRVTNKHKRVWIGGHDAVKEGWWMWADGSKFDYTRWATNEPNNKDGNEHCLEMNFRDNFWNDQECTDTRVYLCSQDLPCCD